MAGGNGSTTGAAVKGEDWRVGSYFLTFHADGKPRHQGYVLRKRGAALEVTLFSWFLGEPTGDEIQPESYFAGARFFPSNEDMSAAAAAALGQDAAEARATQRNINAVFGVPSSPPPLPAPQRPASAKDLRAKSHDTTKKLRFRIFMRDGFKCRYCGRSPPEVELHLDHVVPLSRGGTDDESNLCAACQACNAGKGNSDLHLVHTDDPKE